MQNPLSKQEIEDMLFANNVGRIGCSMGERIYVVPVNYVYDGKAVLIQSYDGLKIEIMRHNPNVCFEIDEISHTALWRSVIARGLYEELKQERERMEAMKIFSTHTLKLNATGKSFTDEATKYQSAKPVIYRIILYDKTGMQSS